MRRIIGLSTLSGATFAFPLLVLAQAQGLMGTLITVNRFLNGLIGIIITIAIIVFFWGLVKYIASASDEAAKESGKTLMIWGMIALFVMVAFWGIIGYVQSSLGVSGSVSVSAPPTINVVPT